MATSTTFVGRRARSRSVQPGPVPGLARRQRSTVPRAMHEQAPDIAVPALRYAPQPVLAATRVLPGHETEPGRELSARTELRAIADRRDQRRRGDDADAGDRRKSAARRIAAVPCQKRRLQRLDPGLSGTELLNQHAKCLARQRRQSPITGIFDNRNQFLHLRRPLSDDKPELRTVAAQRIDHHGALTDQQLTGPVQHQDRLLLRAFRRRKPHGRTRHRLADRFRIRRVVLVRLDEGTNVLRRDQPDLMALSANITETPAPLGITVGRWR